MTKDGRPPPQDCFVRLRCDVYFESIGMQIKELWSKKMISAMTILSMETAMLGLVANRDGIIIMLHYFVKAYT